MRSKELLAVAWMAMFGLAGCTQGGTDGGSTSGGTIPASPAPPPGPGPGPTPPPPPPSTIGTIDPVNGFQTTPTPIDHSIVNDGSASIRIAAGTTAASQTININGATRRYVVLRRTTVTPNAPLLLLLHPSGTSPETMSDLTNIADYVLTQGFVAVMPQANQDNWDDDPSGLNNRDVPFLTQLIDYLIANAGIDATRVYSAGFSNGGFMSERLACDVSDRIAAFAIDAATLRGSQASACTPARQRPKVYFLGTSDPIVPYGGILGNQANGLMSADGTLAYWAARQQCGGVVGTNLPNLANDGTTVQLNTYTGCANGTALQLYTINGGGHAWPGGTPTALGITTQDIAASGLTWLFVQGYRR